MIIDERVWSVAIEQVDAERQSRINRLLSGICNEKEYAGICGFMQGLEYFERALRDAKKPKSPSRDEDED